MKIKYVLMVVTALFALGFAMHRGFTQAPPLGPTIVGPGLAPNVGTPVDPRSLSYYGGYYGGYDAEPSYSSAVSLYNVSFGPQDIPQTSSRITTKLTSSTLSFQWDGEPRAIQSITVSLTDKNNTVISKQVITALPAKATLKRTSKATGYSVNIQYINGMSSNIVSPL
jgi:hypothetical protein